MPNKIIYLHQINMGKTRYNIDPNWHDIKLAYENDNPDELLSIAAIAKKYKVRPQRIYAKAKKDGWQKPLTRAVAPAMKNKNVNEFVRSFVDKILKDYSDVAEVTEWFKDQRAMLLRESQITDFALLDAIKKSVTKADIKKMTEAQKAKWVEVLSKSLSTRYTEERLEEDKSTENVSVIYKHILEMKKRDAISAGR